MEMIGPWREAKRSTLLNVLMASGRLRLIRPSSTDLYLYRHERMQPKDSPLLSKGGGGPASFTSSGGFLYAR